MYTSNEISHQRTMNHHEPQSLLCVPLSCYQLHLLVELLCLLVEISSLLDEGEARDVQCLPGGENGSDPWRRLAILMKLLADDLAAHAQEVALFEAAPVAAPPPGETQLLLPYKASQDASV